MKGYDFSRRQNKKLKDKQWDWADEEFRRLWDVSYNQREIYPNQISNEQNILGLTTPHPEKRLWAIFQPTHPAAAAGDVQLIGAFSSLLVIGSAVAASLAVFEEGMYGGRHLGSAAGAGAGWRTGGGGAGIDSSPNGVRFTQNPHFHTIIRTGSSITNTRLFIGFTPNVNSTWTNSDSGHDNVTATNVREAVYFGWSDTASSGAASSPYWRIHYARASSITSYFIEKTDVKLSEVLPNSIYSLKMWILYDAYLNDADNLPQNGVIIVETARIVPRQDQSIFTLYNINSNNYPYERVDVQSFQQIMGAGPQSQLFDFSRSAGFGIQLFRITAVGTNDFRPTFVKHFYLEKDNLPVTIGSDFSTLKGSIYYL